MKMWKLMLVEFAIIIVFGYGWTMNIVNAYHTLQANGAVDAMFIFRCIGIIVAPLGAILGYF